jgi:hypothetical protein
MKARQAKESATANRTPAQVASAQASLKKAQAVLLAAKANYKVTDPVLPTLPVYDIDRLNKYMMSDNYSLTATALTLSASDVPTDLPCSGATFSCTNAISDIHQLTQLLDPIPIKGADGTIIFATHVGSSYFDPRHQVYFVPPSAVKLVSLGVLSTLGYTVHTDKTRSIIVADPKGTTLCSCPIQSNNTWIFPSFNN